MEWFANTHPNADAKPTSLEPIQLVESPKSQRLKDVLVASREQGNTIPL